jgi:carboxymethylenebutenolidase
MSMIQINHQDSTQRGYLALPPAGSGPGVLLLHAWWGLTDVFTQAADRLAGHGYVVLAPDLLGGQTAETIPQAEVLVEGLDPAAAQAATAAALRFLQSHPVVQGQRLGAVGFSLGAMHALLLDEAFPDTLTGVVLFYGMAGVDLSGRRARFLAHFAEDDEFEPLEEAQAMQANNLERHIYPGTRHWFFEPNRPEYNPQAAWLSWQRTLDFLSRTLGA